MQLIKMSWISIKRHVLIKHTSSPYDATLEAYFFRRGVKEFNAMNILSRQKLAKLQKHLCPLCRTSIIHFDEELVIRHKIPLNLGGTDGYNNLQIVHRSCRDDCRLWKVDKELI
jgi:RNA-directed DNA polymerase